MQWFKKKHKSALYESLEKVKGGTTIMNCHHFHHCNLCLESNLPNYVVFRAYDARVPFHAPNCVPSSSF